MYPNNTKRIFYMIDGQVYAKTFIPVDEANMKFLEFYSEYLSRGDAGHQIGCVTFVYNSDNNRWGPSIYSRGAGAVRSLLDEGQKPIVLED